MTNSDDDIIFNEVLYEETLDFFFSQNPDELKVHIDSVNSSILSDEEKEVFEQEYFGGTDFFNQPQFKGKSIESIISGLDMDLAIERHKKIEYARSNKSKDKKINALLDQINVLRLSSNRFSKKYLDKMKIPPNNIDFEEIILASYISNPSWMKDFSQPYINLLLFKETHQIIHSALISQKKIFTIEQLALTLRSRGNLDEVGGKFYLSHLKEKAISVREDLAPYIDTIERSALLRSVIQFATEISEEAYDGSFNSDKSSWSFKSLSKRSNKYATQISARFDKTQEPILDVVDYVKSLSSRVLELLPYRYKKKYSLPASVDDALAQISTLRDRNGKPLISTGYTKLDKAIHGVVPGKLIMVGARPKIGKTSFSVALATNVHSQGYRSAFFSYEMTKTELLWKFIANEAKVDLEKFEYYDYEDPSSNFSLDEWTRVKDASVKVKDMPLEVEDGKLSSLDYLVNRCTQLKSEHPDLALVVVDGLQSFIHLKPRGTNLSEFYYFVLSTLKNDVAKPLNVNVVLNAQLKIDVESYKNKKPRSIANFSDCKGIPEVADAALLLYRPEHYFEGPEYKGWLGVNPVELRSASKRNKEFKLGIEINYCSITNYVKNKS